MKSLHNFLIEASKWTSTSTDKDYNWDNGDNKSEKKKDYNIKIDDDPEWNEKVKKNIALYIVDSGRFVKQGVYLAIREKLIDNILNKYTGSKVLYAVSATEDEGGRNNRTTIKEISSASELKNNYKGARPLMSKILSNIKENDSKDVDLNIVVSDESLLDWTDMQMKDFDKMINDEINNGLHMLIYAIKEYYYLDKRLEKFLAKDKFEIKVVERDKIYDYSKDKNK